MDETFATFLLATDRLEICRNRQTIRPADVVAFFYKDAMAPPNFSGTAGLQDIAYNVVARQQLSDEDIVNKAKYFYNRVSEPVRHQALASLYRCYGVQSPTDPRCKLISGLLQKYRDYGYYD
ncbi:MAG: hypothetical protein EOO38_24060, partial [Cytophagaceae bacterium]